MTVEEEIEQFIKFYENDRIPDPEHEPIRFAYYVRLFRYEQRIKAR
jgi:hypothetical protein